MRIAPSILAALGGTAAAFGQAPNAGPDQTLTFPSAVQLAGSVQGSTPLNWWTADGNGAFENYVLEYADATGVTPVGPLRTASGGTFGNPTDFARIGATVYGVDALRRQIYTLDPATGIVTPIGTAWSAVYPGVESLAYDPAGDRLFAVDRTTRQLLRIDRTTGAVTPIGNRTLGSYPEIHSLAWRASSAKLYAEDQTTLAILVIDPATGVPSVASHLAPTEHGRIEELDFVGDRLFGVQAYDDGVSLVAGRLQRISPESGVALDFGPVIPNASALCILINSVPEDHVWSKLSGPGNVTFSNTYALDATATFSLPGVYTLKLTVKTPLGPVFDTITLVEDGTPGRIQVLPAADFSAKSAPAGPSEPHSTTYYVTNTTSAALTWRAVAPDPWVSVTPASAQLAAGAGISVAVRIDDTATGQLTLGDHRSLLRFEDVATNVVLQTRVVDLEVTPRGAAGGWTTFNLSPDSRVVYVSSSTGNDGNDGLSESKAKRTLAAGKALLRNGFPDWLLLKRGDTWNETLGLWGISGRSITERMLISSYGASTSRPQLLTGNNSGLRSGFWPGAIQNVAIVGLRFFCNAYDGVTWTRAVECLNGGTNLLIEDCVCKGYNNGIVFSGGGNGAIRQTNATVRRSVVIDSWTSSDTGGNGIYLSECDGPLLEENVIDDNGWIAGRAHSGFPGHNVYIQNGCTGIVFRGNIVATTDGIQSRGGGLIEDNAFLHNAISLELGGGVTPELQGVSGRITRNLILDGGDYDQFQARGWGLWLSNISQSTIDSNVIAHNVSGHAPYPVTFDHANGWSGNSRGVENTVFWNNVVYAWNGYSRFTGNASQTVNVQLIANRIQNEITLDPLITHDQSSSTAGVYSALNVFDSIAAPSAWMYRAGSLLPLVQWKPLVSDTTSYAQRVAFPDPGRTIATYQAMLGKPTTLIAFLAEARLQSKSNWRPEYTADALGNYIRAGFGL